MSAKDKLHEVVKTALQKDGWLSTKGGNCAVADLANYRQWVQQVLTDYTSVRSANVAKNEASKSDVTLQTIFDTEHDHYQLMYMGWENERRVFGPLLHIDIQDGKVWIQWNGTEANVADDLMALGVRREDIVLGFQPPYMRQFTEFAVG